MRSWPTDMGGGSISIDRKAMDFRGVEETGPGTEQVEQYLNIRPVMYTHLMRIACIHLPSFPLQVHMRHALALHSAASWAAASRGDGRTVPAIAVAGSPIDRPGAPVLIACSRAAVAAGVRPGMTVAAARAVAPALVVVPRDPAAERAAVRAVAEALLAVADRVDTGGAVGGAHHAVYAEVPSRSRGAAFG